MAADAAAAAAAFPFRLRDVRHFGWLRQQLLSQIKCTEYKSFIMISLRGCVTDSTIVREHGVRIYFLPQRISVLA